MVTTPGRIGASPHAAPVIGDLEQDRRRSKAANAAQVTIIATYVALVYLLGVFGPRSLYIFPALFAALLTFYDARPDLAQQIFPKLWSETKQSVKRK
jgi:fatty acid desaturase